MTVRQQALPALAGFLLLSVPAAAAVKIDGTYQSLPVQTRSDCTALCRGDKINCVGSIYTETIRGEHVSAVCNLNNGEGEDSPFEARIPEPFDLLLAETDLNIYRAQHGLAPVRLHPQLNVTAQLHSDDQSEMDDASHSSSDGSQLDTRVEAQGYDFRMAAENVACGQLSWDAVFQGWKDSPGHNQNLLAENVTDIGIAMTYKKDTEYKVFWTMVLGAPLS
ncbi:CAP domain-containing protein [Robiginitomaculum antarcticum]|uniref:CAP domain-containing protein n=1 Tax=Robiginitomaculum antarcticum TaxID=437507 RepID=UPI0003648BA3|nr:CAP domain-containing protein [Robiginitomaculum antarcticum]